MKMKMNDEDEGRFLVGRKGIACVMHFCFVLNDLCGTCFMFIKLILILQEDRMA